MVYPPLLTRKITGLWSCRRMVDSSCAETWNEPSRRKVQAEECERRAVVDVQDVALPEVPLHGLPVDSLSELRGAVAVSLCDRGRRRNLGWGSVRDARDRVENTLDHFLQRHRLVVIIA